MLKLAARFILLITFATSGFQINAQSLYYPPLIGNTWETRTPESLNWCTSEIAPLYQYLEDRNTKAFLVLKDGRIVLERYFGTFTADSAWYWASAGKTLTATLIGIAKQEGQLRLTDTTSRYLGQGWTSLPPDKEQKITIWHQLTMTSGLRDNVANDDCTTPNCLLYQADAGTRWAYHNAPYTLLDTVLQSATGQNLNGYINQKLRTTIGMTGLFIKQSYNNVFFSRPRSMARFGLLLLGKGRWNNNQIITDTAYLRQMTTTSQPLNEAYGYLTWLNGTQTYMLPQLQFRFQGMVAPAAPSDMYAAIGKNGQILCVAPSQNLLVIRMGNAPDNSLVPTTLVDTIWQHLNRVMCTTTSLHLIPAAEAKASLVNNQLTFDGNQTWQQVALFDMTGKQQKIKPLAPGRYELDTKPRPGMYYFKAVDTVGKLHSGKLLLQEE